LVVKKRMNMANVKGWIKNFYSRGKGRAIYAKDNIKEKVVNTKDNLKRRHHERKNTREQRRGGISTAKAEKRDLNTAYTETLSNERLSLEEKRARLQEIAEQRDQQKQVLHDYRAQRTAGLRNAKDKVKTGTNAVGRAVRTTGRGIATGASAVKRGSTKVAASAASINFLLLLAVTIHFIDARVFGFSRGPATSGIMVISYTILFIYAYFIVFGNDTSKFLILSSLSIFSFFLPIIRDYVILPAFRFISPSASLISVNFIMIVAPLWVIYIMFKHSGDSKLIKLLSTAYVLGWFIFFMIHIYTNPAYTTIRLDNQELSLAELRTKNIVDVKGTMKRFLWDPGKSLYHKFIKTIESAPEQVQKAWKAQIALATGDYYTGKVDQNANEQLGVYLEDIQMADPEVYEDESVTAWANLKARTLDKEKPVNVTISCWKDKKTESNKGRISPQENFTIYTLEEEEVDCFFDKYKLGKGSHSITFSAGFNFETMSYLKSYFMDKQRKRAMRREEIDIFDQFEIEDKDPIAVYTVGPVMIGMEIREDLPVGIDRNEEEETFVLGITLKNNWEGKIEDVTTLTIITPEYVKLIKDESTKNYCLNYKFDEECNEEDVCKYKLNQDSERIGSVDTYVSLRCPIVIEKGEQTDKNNYDSFLGDTPLTIKYFKVTADYQYAFEQAITVNVKESDYKSEERKEEILIDTIVLHHTATSTAEKTEEVLKERGVSAHYIIDKEGNIKNIVPLERTAYHAGCKVDENKCVDIYKDINQRSIGIEIVNTGQETDKFTDKQYEKVKELIAQITEEYSIPKDKDHILGHYQITTDKWDPSPNFDWNKIDLGDHQTVYGVKCPYDKTHALAKAGYPPANCPNDQVETDTITDLDVIEEILP
jgi:N-acetyl-anhydromuramyl-L-alanine amidase AmpD